MKKLLPWVMVFTVALGGCSSGGEEVAEAVKAPEAEQSVEPAGKAVRVAGIAMSWEGQSVHVGDAWESAQKLFPERRSAYRLRSLPARFGKSFEAHGWETNEGQGYGVITYKDLVIAAIYHAENVEPDYAQGLLEAQRAGTGTLPMQQSESGKLKWSFWEEPAGSQRLMVLLAKGSKGTDVTVLMGDSKVLDALGATKPSAAPSVAPFLTRPESPGSQTSP